jgi:hypothetical protein
MIELLASAIAEPMSAPLWGIFLLAAGMYPVALMLGSSCSPCCGQVAVPCSQCTEGALPETVTVTFDNMPNQTKGPDLITIDFSACFGGGAFARVTAPGGDPDTDKGPISAVTLTSGGSGYAKLGRVAPTLTVSGGSGTGATFTPTLTSTNDACGVPTWALTAVSFKGGAGYVDGEQLTIAVAEGDTEAATATAVVNTTRTQPTLSASIGGGTGATFTVTTSLNFGTPTTWGVASVAVTNGGSGYLDGSAMTFSGGGDLVVAEEAQAYIVTVRSQPSLVGSVSSSGSGASITPTLTQYTGWDGRPYWSVTGFTIADGGTGYSEFDPVEVTVSDGTASPWAWFSAYVSSVDQDGAILAIAIDYGGEYWKDTGVIQSVEVWWGGSYYDDDGIPTGVTVTSGGQYYREDASEPPYVAEVTVTVASQASPSNGTGATFTATVEGDPDSPDFGKITALTIDDGGDDYLAWQWRNTKCCGDYYNGMSIVVKRLNYGSGDACLYSHRLCGVGNLRRGAGVVEVRYRGPSLPPIVALVSEISPDGGQASSICNTTLTADRNITDCGDWGELNFTSTGGATATVEAGGDYDVTFRNPGGSSCTICCKGEEMLPQEIELDFTTTNQQLPSGVVVAVINSFFTQDSSLGWGSPNLVLVTIGLCSGQQTNSSFLGLGPEAGFCGDTCHKECAINITYAPFSTPNLVYRNEGIQSCDCRTTPLCNPYGTFTLCNQLDLTDCVYEVEVRAPL